MAARKRLVTESFKDYRLALKNEHLALNRHLQGTIAVAGALGKVGDSYAGACNMLAILNNHKFMGGRGPERGIVYA